MHGPRLKAPVKVHRCFNPETHSSPKPDCTCDKFVGFRVSEDMVQIGEAQFVMIERKGKLLPDRLAIVATGRRPTCSIPRAPMISESNIERAYIENNQYHAQRIEAFQPALRIAPGVDFMAEVEAGNFA